MRYGAAMDRTRFTVKRPYFPLGIASHLSTALGSGRIRRCTGTSAACTPSCKRDPDPCSCLHSSSSCATLRRRRMEGVVDRLNENLLEVDLSKLTAAHADKGDHSNNPEDNLKTRKKAIFGLAWAVSMLQH